MSKIEEDIAEIKTDLKWMKNLFEQHLSHHWQIKVIALTAVIGGIVSFLIGILK